VVLSVLPVLEQAKPGLVLQPPPAPGLQLVPQLAEALVRGGLEEALALVAWALPVAASH
jgi:hypothetical protein